MIIDDIRTIVRLTFEDIKFQRLLKFALNRIFCEYRFEDEQVVINGARQSYDFKDNYFQGFVEFLKFLYP